MSLPSNRPPAGAGAAAPDVDVVIPVYNEGENIIPTLDSLRWAIRYRTRVLICYDRDDDDTLTAVAGYDATPLELVPVRNTGRGVLGAVRTGFAASTAACVVTMPADDDYNAHRLNAMIETCLTGHDVVVASRFMPGGGGLVGCPRLKAAIVEVADWFLRHVARLPTHDASNGFRIFSRRVIDRIPIESQVGFAYSIELLVKAHRLGWPVVEMPVEWHQRKAGQSRFQIVRWLPQYVKWMLYALATTYARRGAASVKLNDGSPAAPASIPPAVAGTPLTDG